MTYDSGSYPSFHCTARRFLSLTIPRVPDLNLGLTSRHTLSA